MLRNNRSGAWTENIERFSVGSPPVNHGSDRVEGNFLARGIGFYLDEVVTQDEFERQESGVWNPGHLIGMGLGAMYVVSPLDFIPDFIPVLGLVDDYLVLRLSTSLGGYIWNLLRD